MRFELGLSFEAWLKSLSRAPTQEELDFVTARLLDALQVMHAADFLHRDIAPTISSFVADGTPVLLDFGAARRAVAEMSRSLTGIVKRATRRTSSTRRPPPAGTVVGHLRARRHALPRVVGKPPEEATLRFDEDHMPSARRRRRAGIDPTSWPQ